MKIATFNVNGVRRRLQHLLEWLAKEAPDVVCLQELKAPDEGFTRMEANDRATVESLIADDFHFTSPLDNRLDRATFFKRCWPNAADMARFAIDRLVVMGDRAYVTCELTTKGGKRFRNTELLTVGAGKVHDTEVYFGWNIPHDAVDGGFVDKPPSK